MKGIDVLYIFKDVEDDLKHREFEFETNRQRADFTPAELAFAIEDIHKRRQAIGGIPTRGSPNSGWTQKIPLIFLGYTQELYLKILIIAETLHAFPELSQCDTVVEIKQAVKGMQKKFQRESALKSYRKSRSFTGYL